MLATENNIIIFLLQAKILLNYERIYDMSKWKEIRCDYYNIEEEKYFVDAWKTSNDNEEGTVIAKIDLANETVE